MLKKLRIRLIATSMISLTVILATVIAAINIINYNNIVKNADDVLSVLSFRDGPFWVENVVPPENAQGPKEEWNLSDFDPSEKDRIDRLQSGMSPEMRDESRYFSVQIDSDGDVDSVDVSKISAVDEMTATEYAKKIIASKKTNGFADDYRYLVREITSSSSEETAYLITFLDCGRSFDTFNTFLLTSIGISVLGLFAIFVLLMIMSGRIIHPVAESIEKQKYFITDAGHEIKTPLTIISADVDILKMDYENNEWLEDISKQTERLTGLTNDLIMLSRLDEGTVKDEQFIEFPLSEVVSETVGSFVQLAKSQEKTISENVAENLTLTGDEKQIRQLLSILMDNAVKYTPNNGEIKISLEKTKKGIKISVFNTAECVLKENVSKLFDRFYRTDESRNSETGGYGIGLSIARAIVENHKGTIEASTEDEKSLLITVNIPV